jgi:pimeloyl-ACP methyl ester carboxylesterase
VTDFGQASDRSPSAVGSSNAAAVFIHGILSSQATWSPLIESLKADEEIASKFTFQPFDYPSPKIRLSITRRIPDYQTLAYRLGTFLEDKCAPYTHLVLISHSQGGLIIQRYLSERLADGRADTLGRIRLIVLLACPNNGSNFMLAHRRFARRFLRWRHAQEQELEPLKESVLRAQSRVLRGIVYASEDSQTSKRIPFKVYAGQEDNIVTLDSATALFPDPGGLPGDHNSIHVPHGVDSEIVATLRRGLLGALDGYETKSGDPIAPVSISPSANNRLTDPFIRIRTEKANTTEKLESREVEIWDKEMAKEIISDLFGSGKV